MLNYLNYLFECASEPRDNEYRAITILNTIDYMYKELRVKYKVPLSMDSEEDFTNYLEENTNIEDYYTVDLPYISKILFKTQPFLKVLGSDNKSKYDKKLNRRCRKMLKFLGFEGVRAIKGNTERVTLPAQ